MKNLASKVNTEVLFNGIIQENKHMTRHSSAKTNQQWEGHNLLPLEFQ